MFCSYNVIILAKYLIVSVFTEKDKLYRHDKKIRILTQELWLKCLDIEFDNNIMKQKQNKTKKEKGHIPVRHVYSVFSLRQFINRMLFYCYRHLQHLALEHVVMWLKYWIDRVWSYNTLVTLINNFKHLNINDWIFSNPVWVAKVINF